MCSLASGSGRDDSSSSSSWWWRTKPRHGQPSPRPSASLRVIQAKGVQRLPAVGSEAPTGVLPQVKKRNIESHVEGSTVKH